MAWSIGVPVLGRWRAAKQLCPEIAEKVATDKEHDHPSRVLELIVDAEKPKIQQEYRHLITN